MGTSSDLVDLFMHIQCMVLSSSGGESSSGFEEVEFHHGIRELKIIADGIYTVVVDLL